MIEQIPSTLRSLDCTFSKILVPSTDSAWCSAEVSRRLFFLFLRVILINSSWIVLFSNEISNSACNFMGWGAISPFVSFTIYDLALTITNSHNFAVANDNLASNISCLQAANQAEISQLWFNAKPSLEQQRVMLEYLAAAAIQRFRQSCVQVSSYGSEYHYNQLVLSPENIWLERYPGVSPQARTSDYGWQWLSPGTGLRMGWAHTTSRSKTIFGITKGVWNALNWSRDGADSLDYDSDTGPVLPDRDSVPRRNYEYCTRCANGKLMS